MANPDYNFLNDYLAKVTDQSDKVDPNTNMEDDNEFFNTQSDEPEVNEDIQYGITTDQDQQDQFQDSEEQQNIGDNNVLDYLLGDNDPYSEQGYGDDAEADQSNADDIDDLSNAGGNVPPIKGGSGGEGSLGSKISANESGGKYNAMNHHGGGAGAVGKYQFRWNIWKDSIQKVTGVKTREDFQHSPQAQEKYFAWYEKHYLKPAADKLKPYNSMGLNDDQLAQLVHFRGAGGAKKYLLGKMKDKPESYNVPISKYIAKHQAGGQVNQQQIESTKLTPNQTIKFNKWKSELPKNLQYEGDYDLKGLWLENPNVKPSSNLHFPDTYKLPNHPTFSNESKYFNPQTQKYAGHWSETDSSWNYTPYDTNVKKPLSERKMQMGGIGMASTPNKQYVGLNDESFNEMMFPMEGENTFRGLDNDEPVYLEDENGKKKVLKGKHDTTMMSGKVYEKRLNK